MKDSDKKNWRDSFLVGQSLGQSAGMVPRRDKIAVSFASRYVMHEEQKERAGNFGAALSHVHLKPSQHVTKRLNLKFANPLEQVLV